VCFKTLGNLVNGGESMASFNTSKWNLGHNKEHVLVDFICESADRGLPMTYKNIELHPNAIIAGREDPGQPVGVVWVGLFLERYRDKL
ncbi:hypothetical protein C8J57DRAFT_959952, partial [Mycena rebaudengoi]